MSTTAVETQEHQCRNFYRCPKCAHEWDDVWSCACNDTCPQCACRDIEPMRSEPLEGARTVHSFSEAIQAFGVDRDKDPYAIVAARHFGSEGEIEIDDRTVVSQGEGGAYVLAWLWVSNEDLQPGA